MTSFLKQLITVRQSDNNLQSVCCVALVSIHSSC